MSVHGKLSATIHCFNKEHLGHMRRETQRYWSDVDAQNQWNIKIRASTFWGICIRLFTPVDRKKKRKGKKSFHGHLRNPASFIGKHCVISWNCLVVEAKKEKKKQKSTNVSGERCVGDKRGKIIVLPSTLDAWISNQGWFCSCLADLWFIPSPHGRTQNINK